MHEGAKKGCSQLDSFPFFDFWEANFHFPQEHAELAWELPAWPAGVGTGDITLRFGAKWENAENSTDLMTFYLVAIHFMCVESGFCVRVTVELEVCMCVLTCALKSWGIHTSVCGRVVYVLLARTEVMEGICIHSGWTGSFSSFLRTWLLMSRGSESAWLMTSFPPFLQNPASHGGEGSLNQSYPGDCQERMARGGPSCTP